MGLQYKTKTAADVMIDVKRRFGDESGVQVTDEDLIRWINMGQAELCMKSKILRARATTTLIEGQSTYDFEAQNLIEIDSLHVNGVRIPYFGFPDVEEEIYSQDPGNTAKGSPKLWYQYGGQITFWPTPDNDIPNGITIFYVKGPEPVSSGNDALALPDKYYTTLVAYVTAQAYELDEDWEASGNKLQQVTVDLNEFAESENEQGTVTYPTITTFDY